MRRKDRERDATFAYEVLRDCEYITLATINPDGTPYCIPLSHALVENVIYFHCATEGQKLENIRLNKNVCVSGVRYTNILPEKFTTEYESAVATGFCAEVVDDDEKLLGLIKITEKYAPDNMGNFEGMLDKYRNRVSVYKIDIVSITGKANMP